MEESLKTERVTLLMSAADLKRIDDWSFDMRIRSRGEAIRRLIELGLAHQRDKAGHSEGDKHG